MAAAHARSRLLGVPRRPTYERRPTFPSYHSMRQKPRRWPLVIRFIKGAVHVHIALPVLLHAAFAAVICYVDFGLDARLGIPSASIPSLSIVVGLMLVFRNSTSYDRFWQGNQLLTTLQTSIRNLTRSFLACSYKAGAPPPTPAERADTERSVRILLALIFAAKNHLRAEWGQPLPLPLLLPTTPTAGAFVAASEAAAAAAAEYDGLLPAGTHGHEEQGLGLLLQLSVQVEAYIKRAHDRGWFHSPQASQMTVQLNTLVAAYGSMETIRLTPLPVAYLIHTRQVLALFCCVVPFALVREIGWWSILMVAFIAFTLYGIEAIGAQLEDPFGYDKADIKVDAIVEDLRVETMVLLDNWIRRGDMFPVPGQESPPAQTGAGAAATAADLTA